MIKSDNKYFLQKNYVMKWYEVDYLGILKPASLLNYLQDIATASADKIGFGTDFTIPRNYAWFLIKYHMEFSEYPKNFDEVTLKTEARGCSKILTFRDFELWNKEKCIGRISSQWMMINLEDKKFLPLSKMNIMPEVEQREDDLRFTKVVQLEEYDSEKEFEIRYDDLDINRHVNNANYIVWAFETIEKDFRSTHKLKTLDLVYKKEVTYGHNVISKIKIDNLKTHHLLTNKDTGESLCIIDAQWEEL